MIDVSAQTTEQKKDFGSNVYAFSLNTFAGTEIFLVRSDCIENAVKRNYKRLHELYEGGITVGGTSYLGSIRVDKLIEDLKIKTLNIQVAEPTARPTEEQLAQLLRDRGYIVYKQEIINDIFMDKELTCVECGKGFTFTENEQKFFADKGFVEPRRCAPCRAARKNNKQNVDGRK